MRFWFVREPVAIIVPKCNYSDGHVAFIPEVLMGIVPLFAIFGAGVATTLLFIGGFYENCPRFGFAPG